MKNILSVKKFFYIATFFFVVWILLFDSLDVITLFKYKKRLKELKRKKSFYVENIQYYTKYQKALDSDKRLLEKIAREKYYMKKKKEDIFLVD